MLRARAALAAALGLSALAVAFCFPPIPQDPAYHRFADARAFLGVPNFLNVASNLPFLAVGALGLAWVLGANGTRSFREPWERWPYAFLFASVALVGVGSSYYHWAPSYESLFWDRIAMTLVFTTLLGITVIERVDAAFGARLLPLLVVAGVASLVYGQARDDFCFYGIAVQGLAIFGLPPLLLLRSRYSRTRDLWWVAGLYGAAKAAEILDAPIHRALGETVSGHTLKHLLSAAATWKILTMLRRRHPLDV